MHREKASANAGRRGFVVPASAGIDSPHRRLKAGLRTAMAALMLWSLAVAGGLAQQQAERSEDRLSKLEDGAPLISTVKARRQGQLLKMDYQLVDTSGREYKSDSRDYANPPTFTVFKGDRLVGAGTFEYG